MFARVRTLGIACTLAILAFLAVLASAGKSNAAIDVVLEVNPGASSWLTCGYHGVCSDTPTSGNAIDWANGGNSPVYWRSFGYRSDGVSGAIARAKIVKANGVCQNVQVDVVDIFGFPKGSILYGHTGTWTPGWQFNIYGSSSWQATTVEIGFSVAQEYPDCPFAGPHLHQRSLSGLWTDSRRIVSGKTVYPYWWEPAQNPYPVTSRPYWQSRQSWCWYC